MLDSNTLNEQVARQRHEAEENDAKRRAQKLGLPYMNLISATVPTEIKALALVSETDAKKAVLAPLQLVKKTLIVAVFDSEKPETKTLIDDLKKKYELKVVVSSMTGITHVWSYYQYIVKEKEISGRIEINEERLKNFEATIKSLEDLEKSIHNFKSPYTTEILEIILSGAMALHASDIHFEPVEHAGTLRLRIDGLLHSVYDGFTPHTYELLVTRIKLLSNLKLNVKDEPQDGRFTIQLKDRAIEIRTSIIPSEYGETGVLRLLDPQSLKVNLEELGWRADDLVIAKQAIQKPNGLILNTGPTGSGKTTTLYAFLRFVQKPEIKIITVEDPIEYHLAGISQTQVDPDAGYTFASGLRSILRQDPNIILIGEIRDKETAEIALNASLTGHLVFSTLHTNDAVGAIPRLLDLDIKGNIVGPSLSLVIAQRLVRTLCSRCKVKREVDEALKKKIETFVAALPSRVEKSAYATPALFDTKGCAECGNLGYRGRISIFELFPITNEIEETIYKNPTEIELKRLAKQTGMVTMQEDGVLKTLQGATTFDEVERLTGPIAWSG